MDHQEEAIALTKKAFDQARLKGKRDWDRMTVAVLKNRLLMLTDGRFDLGHFGVPTIVAFAQGLGPEFRLATTDRPPVLELLSVHGEPQISDAKGAATRIRPDLWNAVMDFQSGRRRLWDPSRGIARLPADGEMGLELPLLTSDEFDQWRRTFAETQAAAGPEEAEVVRTWAATRAPTSVLPPRLRPTWNDYMKAQVAQRLRAWFDQQQLPLPADLEMRAAVALRKPRLDSPAGSLREFLAKAVLEMSEDDLETLWIPAVAAWKASRGSR